MSLNPGFVTQVFGRPIRIEQHGEEHFWFERDQECRWVRMGTLSAVEAARLQEFADKDPK